MSIDEPFEVLDPQTSLAAKVIPLRANAAPWTHKIWETALARGGRIRVEEAIVIGMPLVPPGQAYRDAERAREAGYRQTHGSDAPIPPRIRRTNNDDFFDMLVHKGQRNRVRDSIEMLCKYERFLIEVDEEGVKWLVINTRWRPQARGKGPRDLVSVSLAS